MLRIILVFIFTSITSSIIGQVDPSLVDIPQEVFVNNGRTDFSNILYQDDSLKEKVRILVNENELSHDFSSDAAEFEKYWSVFKAKWHFIRFQKKNEPLLIFSGLKNANDEREYVEIFDLSKKLYYRQVFSEVGKLLAFQIQPYTQELVLFTHKYPCCKSASHNIYTIRQVNGDLHVNDRFFVGRDSGDMVGPFFPLSVKHSKKYYKLKERVALRWSPKIVEHGAFEEWTESNLMIHYEAGALYKILYDDKNWQFVLFLNGIAEEQSMMLNYTNFLNKGVYGWIKK